MQKRISRLVRDKSTKRFLKYVWHILKSISLGREFKETSLYASKELDYVSVENEGSQARKYFRWPRRLSAWCISGLIEERNVRFFFPAINEPCGPVLRDACSNVRFKIGSDSKIRNANSYLWMLFICFPCTYLHRWCHSTMINFSFPLFKWWFRGYLSIEY